MKKVYQIKESEIFKIISNLISEQSENNKNVTVSGGIGQSPKYDGLKVLFKNFRQAVQAELRKETPYMVVNGSTKVGRGGGNEITLTLTLEKCKEEERHWFFDLAGAIYSYDYSQNSSNTRFSVFRALGDKSKMFTGTKEGGVKILKTNTVGLTGIKDIDPKNPEKQYTLHAGYVVGIKSEDYSELGPAPAAAETKKAEEPQPASENPPAETATTAAVATTKAAETPAAPATTPASEPTKKNENMTIPPISGTFSSNNGDTAHNFKNLEIKLTGEKDKDGNIKTKGALQELYDKGINPKILDLSAKIVRKGNQFTTTYKATVGPSDDGKAWMGFTARGSFGNDYIARADGQIDGTENKDGKTLEDKLKTIGAGEVEKITVYEDKTVPVKQYFVQFTKPKEFPPHK